MKNKKTYTNTINENKQPGLSPELEVGETIRIVDIDREIEGGKTQYTTPGEQMRPERWEPYTVVDKKSNGSQSKWSWKYTLVPPNKVEEYEKSLDRGWGNYEGYEKLLYPWIYQWIYADTPSATKVDRLTISEALRQTKNINPDLMVGDEIMVVSTEGIHDFGSPVLYKPYVVVGIKHAQRQNWQGPETDTRYYQIEPIGMTDKERTGAMLAGGGRAKPLYVFPPEGPHGGSDQWILRKGFRRGELEEEGETNEAARTLSKARKAGVDTYYPKSAVKANPQRFRKYTRDKYLKEQNQSGVNPELEVDDIIRVMDVDGEHGRMPKRFGIYKVVKVGNAHPLMAKRNRGHDTFYDITPYPEVEARVTRYYKHLPTHHEESDFTLYRGDTWIYWDKDRYKYKEMVSEQGVNTSWANDDDKITLQDILDLTKHIKIVDYPTEKLAKIVLNWDDNPEEIERISQVEVSQQYPILIMVNEDNKILWILDGNHRAQKALMNNVDSIPAKLIKPSDLDERSIKMFFPKGIPSTNQTISENKESIDSMVYIEKPRKKHLQKMDNTLGNFQEFNLEKFKNTPPPKNDSKVTEDEIKEVQKIKINKKFVDTTDDIHKHFEDFLKTKDVEYPKKEVNKSMKGLSRIILELKYHYNRPRPEQIAEKKKLKLKPTKLDTASTPSYPSGHALRGRFIGRYLSEKYPDYKNELMKLGDDIGDGRLMAKVHYPSDNKFGKKIGDELYNHYTTKYKEMVSEQVTQEDTDSEPDPDDEYGTFNRKDIIILNYISKMYNEQELREIWDDTSLTSYGKSLKKWEGIMKLFSVDTDGAEEFARSSKYARWAWENWDAVQEYNMDYSKIPNPLKTSLKWFEVDKEETGSQVEYRRGEAEILGFDEDNVGAKAEYDFYEWGDDMETYDYGDYESYDTEIADTRFLRLDESTEDKQKLLFNFWKKVGPTLDPNKLKLVGFNMSNYDDKSVVWDNLKQYYGDEGLNDIIEERLEGLHDSWSYEYIVTNAEWNGGDITLDILVNGDAMIPISQESGGAIDMSLWEINEKAQNQTLDNYYDDNIETLEETYEEARNAISDDIIGVLLQDLPLNMNLDYMDISEPGTFETYVKENEVEIIREQVMVDKGDMLKSDIFKILSNTFILTPTDYSEIKDNQDNYYGIYDIKLGEYVNMSDLVLGVSDFISYGVESGDFKEKDVQKGIAAITDWISLMMNQEKDLPN